MKKRLKALVAADFPSITDSKVNVEHRGGGAFEVRGYVDAENSLSCA